ncbi:PREDICTED: coiled-coil domain-containing protein 43 [Dufourea novaeangliae]|uniref:Coiled-coil domain-containing protein 43 n=1 Tax=Dufourea novaeangliae TaxID=178035 RepID=A0A154PFF4_DUFNO|nr:PREDICTED: coiled-coil domain-containing protein 43 [Dufourea novaeangliae]KZC10174.1 Coiled-coil domain-containing protein 43 [Dufourea novaeangliae]
MAVAANSFDSWLSTKLQALNTDEGVFVSYIKGILEGDETEDEKTEALEGLLAGITDDDISNHVTEILSAWAKWLPMKGATASNEPVEDVDVRLAKMLESQSLATTTQRGRAETEEERRVREAILAQYSQISDEENSDGEKEEDGASGGDYGIEKNTNAAVIVQKERERREMARIRNQMKKEKDKEEREKQKQLRDEKKEKRKTQKQERRR